MKLKKLSKTECSIDNSVYCSDDIDLSEYEYAGNVDGYLTYRKIEIVDGKPHGVWVAQDQDKRYPPFHITYDQARGYEPITKYDTNIKKLSRDLGKMLLPDPYLQSSVKCSRKPKWWNTQFRVNVIDAFNKGELTFKNIDEWEKEYNGGVAPNPKLGTKEILKYYINNKDDIKSSFEDDDLEDTEQEFTSKDTSVNSSKLPAIFKLVKFQPNTVNLDYGGGKFDNATKHLKDEYNVDNYIVDKYNRTPEENSAAISAIRANGGADTATCSNVLNVIKEPEARLAALRNIKKLVKPSGTVYITVYEGSGKGNEQPTKLGYQRNLKTESYLEEIKQVFPDAVRKGKLIVAHPGAISESCSINSASYGGAFDIFDDEFFTKEEILEFGFDVCEKLSELFETEIFLSDCYTEKDNSLTVQVSDYNYEWSCSFKIDMRKIRKPYDLYKYVDKYVDNLKDQIDSDYGYISESCSTSKIKSAEMITGNSDYDDLEAKLLITTEDFMVSRGFSRSEASDYYFLDMSNTGDGYILIEVRAELSYDDMFELCMELDDIVEPYDPNAYFDLDSPGIAVAYVEEASLMPIETACNTVNIPSKPGILDEDEYIKSMDEGRPVSGSDTIFVNVTAPLIVQYDGSWEIENSKQWLDDRYDITEYHYKLDSDKVYEDICELIDDSVPETPGEYTLKGDFELVYDVSQIDEMYIDEGPDPEGGYFGRYEYNFDYSKPELDVNKSSADYTIS